MEAYANDIRSSQLKRTLGKWELTAIGIGAVIGGGLLAKLSSKCNQCHWITLIAQNHNADVD